ncbi:atherin-like [Cricetulus griseus]|uniref:Atherin-like n=1 Tax=Cricetulus griseus TaxID=10029 RepID=A0A9J7H8J1_CRIGR|nr:atherin-like [Cricetulus griseus]
MAGGAAASASPERASARRPRARPQLSRRRVPRSQEAAAPGGRCWRPGCPRPHLTRASRRPGAAGPAPTPERAGGRAGQRASALSPPPPPPPPSTAAEAPPLAPPAQHAGSLLRPAPGGRGSLWGRSRGRGGAFPTRPAPPAVQRGRFLSSWSCRRAPLFPTPP